MPADGEIKAFQLLKVRNKIHRPLVNQGAKPKGQPLKADKPDGQCDLDTTVSICAMRGIRAAYFKATNSD